jgi:hypothetical protein
MNENHQTTFFLLWLGASPRDSCDRKGILLWKCFLESSDSVVNRATKNRKKKPRLEITLDHEADRKGWHASSSYKNAI